MKKFIFHLIYFFGAHVAVSIILGSNLEKTFVNGLIISPFIIAMAIKTSKVSFFKNSNNPRT